MATHCEGSRQQRLSGVNRGSGLRLPAFTLALLCTLVPASADVVARRMNASADPCDDFYAYACGAYLANAEDGQSVDDFQVPMYKSLVELLEAPSNRESEKTALSKVKRLYRSCRQNVDGSDELSWASASALLSEMHGWPLLRGAAWDVDDIDWIKISYLMMQLGIYGDSLFGIDVVPDLNRTYFVLKVSRPTFDEEPESDTGPYKLNEFSQLLMSALLLNPTSSRLNFTSIASEATDALEFKKKLLKLAVEDDAAASTETPMPSQEDDVSESMSGNLTATPDPGNANENAAESPVSSEPPAESGESPASDPTTEGTDVIDVATLRERYPFVPWLEYFRHWLPKSAVVEDSDVVLVDDAGYLAALNELMKGVSQRTLVNYLVWEAVRMIILPDLNRDARTLILGPIDDPDRFCVELTFESMKTAFIALYARHHISNETEQMVAALFRSEAYELTKLLETEDWLDDNTRSAALRRVEEMRLIVNYNQLVQNQTLLDELYEEIEIEVNDFLRTDRSVLNRYRNQNGDRLHKDVQSYDWLTEFDDIEVKELKNSESLRTKNAVFVGPAWYPNVGSRVDRPQYIDHAILGSYIGKYISYTFDTDDVFYNGWNESTESIYSERTKCMVRQYENMTTKESNFMVNGTRTMDENIANSLGLRLAYRAYRRHVQLHGEEPSLRLQMRNDSTHHDEAYHHHGVGPVLSSRQLFWLVYASSRCSKLSQEEWESFKDSVHLPPVFQVTGNLMNQEDFATDFNCPLGSRMNPVEKCNILG